MNSDWIGKPFPSRPGWGFYFVPFGWLMGGIVVVESVFSYPGLGRLTIFAIQKRDIPMIQASILIMALIYISANLIADLLYMVLDPKTRE